jgi:sRNA-binding regulator protein Hfq
MYISASLQDKYFLELVKSKIPVAVHLKSGKKYHGVILSVTEDLLFIHTPSFETIRRNQIRTIIPLNS